MAALATFVPVLHNLDRVRALLSLIAGGAFARRRIAHKRKVRKRPNGEIAARAELRVMRELVVILVQAITDLLACFPSKSRRKEQIRRIEATLAKLQRILAERQKSWAGRGFRPLGQTT